MGSEEYKKLIVRRDYRIKQREALAERKRREVCAYVHIRTTKSCNDDSPSFESVENMSALECAELYAPTLERPGNIDVIDIDDPKKLKKDCLEVLYREDDSDNKIIKLRRIEDARRGKVYRITSIIQNDDTQVWEIRTTRGEFEHTFLAPDAT